MKTNLKKYDKPAVEAVDVQWNTMIAGSTMGGGAPDPSYGYLPCGWSADPNANGYNGHKNHGEKHAGQHPYKPK